VRRLVAALVTASILALSAAPAHAQDRRPPRGSEQSSVPVSWIVVGGGVLLVFAAIPLVVQADKRARREDGLALGRKNADCGAAPTVCGVLASADTDTTPWWVAAGITAGLGVGIITTGAILHWQFPSTRGEPVIAVEPAPGGGAASLRLRF
jgi:hypothetical protein